MYRLICQKPAHFLSAQMALVSTFFQMFIVLGMYNFDSGIGLETARDLAARGARLILAVGNMEKGINAAKDIVETTGNNNLVVRKLDLASIEEVRKFAQQVNDAEEKLDILILNGNMG